jgi:membrane-bound lytic murein transglycosylase F
MGFEYDLARAFAGYLGVDLEIRVPGWNRLFDALLSGEGDIIAAGIARTGERLALADFSDSYMPVRQQVIVHKNNYTIETVHDLAGCTIHVRQGTAYEKRLQAIQKEGIAFTIVSHRDIPTEELIRLVAEKQIQVTVANSNIALLNRRYYPDIKIAFPIEDEQHLAWAVRRKDKALAAEINAFLKAVKDNGNLEKIYNQYYAAVDAFDYVDLKTFHQRMETRLPEYSRTIRSQAEKFDFDWRLIAAMIYQESHFDPAAVSHTGVMGIMQLSENTALALGVTDRMDPFQSIRGGVRYLDQLRARFEDIEDPRTRLLFALAGYNIGYCHVRDAQELARRLGLGGNSWQDMKTTLPLLQLSEYYATTPNGYARGKEPVEFVEKVLSYYDILKQKEVEFNKTDAAPPPDVSPPAGVPEPSA